MCSHFMWEWKSVKLNYKHGIALKLLVPTTNLEKQPQEMIHFEVDIAPSWQATTTKLLNLFAQPTIDQTSIT
jgi:hypothetical protein